MVYSKKTAARVLAAKRAALVSDPFALDPMFPKQSAFVEDPARFLTAQCSRRAGKTNGLALRFFRTLQKHPGAQCIYLALTRESALNIMWPVLLEMNDRHNLGCTFLESKLEMHYPNGAKLRLLGADMKNFIKRLRGIKTPGVGIDEAQDFGPHLESLVDDVLTPAMSDYEDSWLAMTGTPGPVPQGYFFEITQNGRFGYSRHEWTMLDNPHMPHPGEFLADLKKKREWDDQHPTLLREWLNRWVLDVQSLWVRYNQKLNGFQKLPELKLPEKYTYILGIDIGYRDSDALAILAYSDVSKEIFLCEEIITPKQDITGLIEQIKGVEARYDISKMVFDEGGGGKKVAEEIRRRHHIPIHAADKMRKQENVDLLNDYLRLGLFKAHPESRFVKDSYQVQIDWDKSTPNRIVIKKHPHSDIIDAVLYAFKESPAYTYTPPPPVIVKGTPAHMRQVEDEMWEKALEEANAIKEERNRMFGDD